MNMRRVTAAAIVAGLALASTANAAQSGSAGTPENRLYITPGAIYYKSPRSDDHEIGPAAIVGYTFNEWVAAEVLWGTVESDLNTSPFDGSRKDADTDLYWANLLVNLGQGERVQPFALFGAGYTDIDSENDTQFNAGLGLYIKLNQRFRIRGDVRGVYSHDEKGFEPMGFLGLSVALGSLEPPPPPDTDGDGVPDPSDRCPNTPPGRDVGPDGCERDSDGDGVNDYDDKCPNTPRGAKVDSTGCPLDSDGDGVFDGIDQCPGTPKGAKVDSRGCPIELQEDVTIDLNLEFGFDSATLTAEHKRQINDVVDFIKQYPQATAMIEGHTDSVGPDEYNQGLSERRARAVRDYLVNDVGANPNRLTMRGYGESRPIDTNDTDAGRQHNRRVSVVFSGTDN
jgi:OOP family OmpA-OmpF porin